MASLAAQLTTFSIQFQEKCSPGRSSVLQHARAILAAELHTRTLLQPGDQAPDFSILDSMGNPLQLFDILARSPVILSFYRGGWCPYCVLELRAYQQLMPQIEASNISLIAISPQTPDKARADAESNLLTFTIASDCEIKAARAYRVDYQLDEALSQLYTEIGHPLPDYNGDNGWQLPVPATFVINTDGRIGLSYINADHRKRLEPSKALAVADNL